LSLPRLDEAVTIDGTLDDAAWARAARLTGFSQYQPIDGRPAEERTEVLAWYSPSAVYFAIVAMDRHPGSIRATVADRDRLDQDDTVTIFLDTFNDRRRAFFFGVNPFGIQEDGVQTEGSSGGANRNDGSRRFGTTIDKSPDYQFESKGRLTAQGFVVEVRIPFRSLRYPNGSRQQWRLNVLRKVQRTGYQDTWAEISRTDPSFLAQAGTIELRDLKPGIVAEAQPFFTTRMSGARASAAGPFVRDSADPDAGVNVRVGLPGFSVDATVNPDFSQVESDAGLVTVNERFALFYAEKRPFFLEGIELFATPNQLVYTRRIADPAAGAKVTGKFGPLGIAYLTALDEGERERQLVTIARARADVGTASTVGVALTDREGDFAVNRVLAADARLVFRKLYFVQGQLGTSWTREGDSSRSAPLWLAEFDRTGRNFGFNYKVNAIGEGFNAASGYVPRTDAVEAHAFNRVSFFPSAGRMVESVRLQFNVTRWWRYAGFLDAAPIEGTDNPTVTMVLRGGWNINAGVRREFYRFDPAAYTGYGVMADGRVLPFEPASVAADLDVFNATVTTPVYRAMNGSVEARYGEVPLFAEAGRGRERRHVASLSVRPTTSIRATASGTVATLERASGAEFARTVIARLSMEYQPRRSIFFRLVPEYRTERYVQLRDDRGRPLVSSGVPVRPLDRRGLHWDALFSYQPSPGTVAFFGYGSSLDADPAFGSPLRRSSDGFFVKLAYLFRR
jgi:hypothetical protein